MRKNEQYPFLPAQLALKQNNPNVALISYFTFQNNVVQKKKKGNARFKSPLELNVNFSFNDDWAEVWHVLDS